ncbi:hypothetical protein [Corynebacterium pyruviciproducens]|uniref:hypothetical protein n=1 Tax=Corynebacterium pyruviciproducens TaxID=598660 RepID=UPI0023F30F1A|nr:hypothetical protein [Corynebacterium pyruviciproducens]
MAVRLKPGFLDELGRDIGATTDAEVAGFLGITEDQLEALRYGGKLDPQSVAVLEARRAAHKKAIDILTA